MDTSFGRPPLLAAFLVVATGPGELLIVTADNMALLRFIEDSGMFRRA
jgi:hypothetical protein